MKRFLMVWTLCMLTIAILVACSLSAQDGAVEPTRAIPAEVPAGMIQPVAAGVARRQGPSLEAQEVGDLVQGNNAFAADLYHAVVSGNEQNLILSPYSISLAFSMAYAGARGETEAQMQDTLHFLAQGRQHEAFNSLERHLSSLSAGHVENETTGPAFQLEVANSVWGQRRAPFQDAYLQTLAGEYGAGLNTVDFGADPEAAREAINAWVSDATREKIEEIIAPGALDPQTQLVLVNAIYFYGAWRQPFDPSNTSDGPFTLLDGSTVTVPLMSDNIYRAPYMTGDGYRAVLLPYTGEKADMLLILPDEGQFEAVQEQLSAAFLRETGAGMEVHDMTLTLPRFSFESKLDLAQVLPQLGLTLPFGGGADFSAILEGGGLFVDAAVHKATISVDEKGTEAAAVTEIAMAVSEMPRAEFQATRPFLLAIVERETGAILFLGRLMNPLP